VTSNIPDEHQYGDEPDRPSVDWAGELRAGAERMSRFPGPGGWQGASGDLPALAETWRQRARGLRDTITGAADTAARDTLDDRAATWDQAAEELAGTPAEPLTMTDRAALLGVTIAVRGAALELSAAVRDRDGVLLTGPAFTAAVAGWLRGHGIDPDTGDALADHLPGLPATLPGAGDWTPPGVLRSLRPVPPDGLPILARHRWVCAWALTVQARKVAGLPDFVFHGIPSLPGCDVAIETRPGPDGEPGDLICELANTGYLKSPAGFGAGYEGSGAAALARSLLTAALGTAAACPGCLGSGRVTYLAAADTEDPVPWQLAHDALSADDAAVVTCDDCDGDGLRIHPKVYQQFKRSVVAALPGDGEWTLDRGDVISWLRAASAARAGEGSVSWAVIGLPS
jgi:hypothetical protein